MAQHVEIFATVVRLSALVGRVNETLLKALPENDQRERGE
jgi:hypothetical protein